MHEPDMRADQDLRPRLQEIMRDLHMIKSALYLDITLAESLNVTRQIGRMNDLSAKMLDFYRELTGEAPPATPPLYLAKPGTLSNFDSRKVNKTSDPIKFDPGQSKPKPPSHLRPKRNPGRPPKTDEVKIAEAIEQSKRPKKKKNKTTKVKGARKGHRPPNTL